MQDRHEAVLDANITNFKQKMKEASNDAKLLGEKLQTLTKGDIVGGEFINIFSNKISIASGRAKLLGNNFKLIKPAVKEIGKEIENLDKKTEKITIKTEKTGNEISKSFNKGLKSVKRLTIGFLGARSAFGLFRKYMSEYSSQNEEFAQKMQLTTNIITTALAPAFEFFANVIQYAVIGLARIIELLTGVNILGKTIDTSFKGASKSAKEFNENLSGLDEISNIDQSASGLSTGIGSQLKAMEDFQKKIAEVDAWFKKHKIDEKILAIKNAIKSVWNWAKEHPILATAFVAGLLTLKDVIIPGLIGKLTGTGGGFSLLSGFKALIAIELVAGVWNLSDSMWDLSKSVWDTADALDEEAKKWQSSADARKTYMKLTGQYSEEETKNTQEQYKTAIQTLQEEKKELEKLVNLKNWIIHPADYYDAKEKIEDINKQIKEIKHSQDQVTVGYEIANDKVGEAIPLTENMKTILQESSNRAKIFSETTSNWQKNIRNANIDVGKFKGTLSTGFNVPLKFNTDTTSINNALTNVLKKFNKAFGSLGIKLPSYDVGTAYVPNDQIAMIHEGERIIPKQYNNPDYLGQLGNSETNMLLLELNKSILELANKPSVFNVNGKELARATYGDFENEDARRGKNMAVRRV